MLNRKKILAEQGKTSQRCNDWFHEESTMHRQECEREITHLNNLLKQTKYSMEFFAKKTLETPADSDVSLKQYGGADASFDKQTI